MMNSAAARVGPLTEWVGVVHADDGVRFVAVAPSRGALLSRVAAYVGDQAQWKLWPDMATRVQQLVSNGAAEVAIRLYFESVGDRWDPERLHITEVAPATEARRIGGTDGDHDIVGDADLQGVTDSDLRGFTGNASVRIGWF
jgi:hypothetical protein